MKLTAMRNAHNVPFKLLSKTSQEGNALAAASTEHIEQFVVFRRAPFTARKLPVLFYVTHLKLPSPRTSLCE
jgi:hypothetical protein